MPFAIAHAKLSAQFARLLRLTLQGVTGFTFWQGDCITSRVGLWDTGQLIMIRIAFADDESMVAVEYRRSRETGKRMRAVRRAHVRGPSGPDGAPGRSMTARDLVALLADSCSDFAPRTWRHAR